MRRIAAHYIFWKQLLPLHYMELDDNNLLVGVFPLKEELAGTEFADGVVYPATEDMTDQITSLKELEISGVTDCICLGDRVVINQLR